MAAGVEIKQASGDAQLATAQLALWFTAGFLHLRHLQRDGWAKRLLKDSRCREQERKEEEEEGDVVQQQPSFETAQPANATGPSSSSVANAETVDSECNAGMAVVGDSWTVNRVLPSEDRSHRPRLVHFSDILPMVGWTAVGHEWRTYIACVTATENIESRKIEVFGPFPKLNTNTASFYEIFKLLSLMQRVKAYAKTTRWPWLEKDILRPLVDP